MVSILRRYKIKLNPNKHAFGLSLGTFLGYMVNQRGIKESLYKIYALFKIVPPKTMKNVQRLARRLIALSKFILKAIDRNMPFFKKLRGAKKYN